MLTVGPELVPWICASVNGPQLVRNAAVTHAALPDEPEPLPELGLELGEPADDDEPPVTVPVVGLVLELPPADFATCAAGDDRLTVVAAGDDGMTAVTAGRAIGWPPALAVAPVDAVDWMMLPPGIAVPHPASDATASTPPAIDNQ